MGKRCERTAGRSRRERVASRKKKFEIIDLLGFALGCVRLSYDDFCRCTPEEFNGICKAYHNQRETDYKNEWERMRMLATITIQPHTKSKITAQKLLPFPWEKHILPQKKDYQPVSAEEDLRRFEVLIKRNSEINQGSARSR